MEKQEEMERKETDRNGEAECWECWEGCREWDLEEWDGVRLEEIMRVSERSVEQNESVGQEWT